MTIQASELIPYGSASRPSDDVSTAGGAIDLTDRPEVTQIAAADNVEVLSDGADTRTVTVQGRDSTGAVISEVLTLNGTTPVSSTLQYERILTLTLSASSGSLTATIRRLTGSTLIASIGLNEVTRTTFFRRSSSEAGAVDRVEKFFFKNTNVSLQLNNPVATLTADPAARITMGLALTQNDTVTVANRKAMPAGISFVDDNVAQTLPGTGLAAASGAGIWIKQGLLSADTVKRSTFTVEINGTSV